MKLLIAEDDRTSRLMPGMSGAVRSWHWHWHYERFAPIFLSLFAVVIVTRLMLPVPGLWVFVVM